MYMAPTVGIESVKILLILLMFFSSLAFSEDFNLICEGERKVRNLSSKDFNEKEEYGVKTRMKKIKI